LSANLPQLKHTDGAMAETATQTGSPASNVSQAAMRVGTGVQAVAAAARQLTVQHAAGLWRVGRRRRRLVSPWQTITSRPRSTKALSMAATPARTVALAAPFCVDGASHL
jgi:hypothetical protein